MNARSTAIEMLRLAQDLRDDNLILAADTIREAALELLQDASNASDLKSLLPLLQQSGATNITLSAGKANPITIPMDQAVSVSSQDNTDAAVPVRQTGDNTWVGIIDGQRFTLTAQGVQKMEPGNPSPDDNSDQDPAPSQSDAGKLMQSQV